MKKFILFVSFLIASCFSSAQLYQTKTGLITISGLYKGNAVVAESRQLHMNLNYDKAEISMHVAVPFLVTENDTLNKLLQKMAGIELSFHGIMNGNHVHTKPHPKLQQQVSGTVTVNKVTRPFKYAATLEHFPSGNISCVLSGSFKLNLLDFGIATLPGENNVAIQFRELLLKKANE